MIRQLARYGIAILVLAFLMELALLGYTALAAVVIGSVVSWPLVHLARFIVANWKRIWLPVIVTLSLVGCALYLVVLLPLFLTPDPPPPLIQQYHMTIDQANWRTGDFTIKETVGINPEWVSYRHVAEVPASIDLPERNVTSTRIGLLVREIRIMPDQADLSGEAVITLPDGRILKGGLCSLSCGTINIEIPDAPAGSFLAAKGAKAMQELRLSDRDAISWSGTSLDQGITFVFVPPPYNIVQPILQPVVGLSALDPWLLGIFGLLSTLLIAAIWKSELLAVPQNISDSRLDKWPGTGWQDVIPKKTGMNVSNEAQELEVDIFGLRKKR
jgi:hypothetical protein